jgi:hypothetical protein
MLRADGIHNWFKQLPKETWVDRQNTLILELCFTKLLRFHKEILGIFQINLHNDSFRYECQSNEEFHITIKNANAGFDLYESCTLVLQQAWQARIFNAFYLWMIFFVKYSVWASEEVFII